MLTFTEHGLITPAEGIPTTPDGIYEIFVRPFPQSETRERIFNEWRKYNRMLRQEIGVDFTQWVDGSFVTQKRNPRDVDIVSFIPSYLFRKFEKRLDYYWTDNWEREGIDAYLVEVLQEGQPEYESYKTVVTEWVRLYTTTKATSQLPNERKGFLITEVQ